MGWIIFFDIIQFAYAVLSVIRQTMIRVLGHQLSEDPDGFVQILLPTGVTIEANVHPC